MKMKRLLPILLFLITTSIFAQQNRGDRHKKIKVLKIAFITEKLDLTEDEAQKFWPIYNAFDERTSKIKFQDIRKIRYELRRDIETLSEEKANNLLNIFIEAENKLHNEKVQLVEKLRNVISAKKIILLKSAEEDFNKKMLEQYQKRRQQRMKKDRP
jgi:Spy/CpxP family protein refolding chaperone